MLRHISPFISAFVSLVITGGNDQPAAIVPAVMTIPPVVIAVTVPVGMRAAWEPLASVAILTGSLRLRELHRIRNLLRNAAWVAAPKGLLSCPLGSSSCTGLSLRSKTGIGGLAPIFATLNGYGPYTLNRRLRLIGRSIAVVLTVPFAFLLVVLVLILIFVFREKGKG